MTSAEALREKIDNTLKRNMLPRQGRTYAVTTEEILQAFKDAGGVFLDPDQSLPEPSFATRRTDVIKLTQQDMLKANFKKVKEVD